MGLLGSVLGGLLGGGGSSPLMAILASILSGNVGGQAGNAPAGQAGGGLGGALGGALGGGMGGGLGPLLDRLRQAGLGEHVDSWVGTGPNRQVDPGQLRDAFGQHQVDQWSQQTGMSQGDLLGQLSNLIPHAVDRMTPEGTVPPPEADPFDGAGFDSKQ